MQEPKSSFLHFKRKPLLIISGLKPLLAISGLVAAFSFLIAMYSANWLRGGIVNKPLFSGSLLVSFFSCMVFAIILITSVEQSSRSNMMLPMTGSNQSKLLPMTGIKQPRMLPMAGTIERDRYEDYKKIHYGNF